MQRHMISTQAVKTTCRRCRRLVLSAQDEGLLARVEPKPLDNAGEIAALLNGLRTYTHTAVTHELVERNAERIAGGRLVGTIHAEHQCPQGGKS